MNRGASKRKIPAIAECFSIIFPPPKARGSSLVELLVVMAIIAILSALLLPALSRGQLRVKRAWCEHNLRQMGIVFHSFAHDHDGKFPMAVPTAHGGSLEFVQNGFLVNGPFYFAFRHFQTLANQLDSPQVLVCPADIRRAASNFRCLQNNNVSYFVAVDAEDDKPMTILAGDGNLTTTSSRNPTILPTDVGGCLMWNHAVHQFKGNVLFADGHVEEWGNAMPGKTTTSKQNLILPTINPAGATPQN